MDIGVRLFGSCLPVGSLASEVADACERDAWSRIRAALDLRPGSPEDLPALASTASPWAGAVVANLPLGMRMLMTATLVDALLKRRGIARSLAPSPRGGLVAVREALSNTSYAVEVQLDGCEIEIGALQDLQVGDVLRIQHPLDAPASVRSDGGATLFNGFLARSRGRKAVELAPRSGPQPSAKGMS
jgi:hypothetical protein